MLIEMKNSNEHFGEVEVLENSGFRYIAFDTLAE